MKAKNKKIKFISAFLIILTIAPAVLFSKPKPAEAQWLTHDMVVGIFTGSTAGNAAISSATGLKKLAAEILQEIVRALERALLQALTKSVVNWINSGFHGAPLFLTNPDSFFSDIAKSATESMINQYGYNSNQYPFGQSFALNIINSYKQTAANDAAYSLNQVLANPTNFINNFNTGGWNGFLINSQYPQNNYLGFNMMATDQLARQLQGTVQNTAQKVRTTLQQGMGFLSPETCSTNPNYNNGINEFNPPQWNSSSYLTNNPPPQNNCGSLPLPNSFMVPSISNPDTMTFDSSSYNAAVQQYQQCTNTYTTDNNTWNQNLSSAQASFNSPTGTNVCPPRANGASGLVATTPGSVVASHIKTAINTPFMNSQLGSMIGGSIAAVIDTLTSHFIGQGLTALGSAINPPPAVDTFTYQGQSLTSSTTGAPPPANAGPGACYTNGGATPVPSITTQIACGNANDVWIVTVPTSALPPGSPAGCYSTAIDGSLNQITTATTTDYCTEVGGTWYGSTPTLTGCYSIDGTIAMSEEATPADCNNVGGVWNGPAPAITGTCSDSNGDIITSLTSENDCTGQEDVWTPTTSSAGTCVNADGSSNSATNPTDCANASGTWTATNVTTNGNGVQGVCTINGQISSNSQDQTPSGCGNDRGTWSSAPPQ